ncbi:MAG TPA: hypothetical protein VFH73_04250, partial [Polyangia bacterium]|nr:hypothetical protein [Polyangia bacterium]
PDSLERRPGEPDSLERRAGALLREIKPPATWSSVQLSRVRMRLDGSIRPTTASHRRAAVVWVLVGALMLLGTGVVAAARGWAPGWPILSALLPHRSPASSEERAPRRVRDRISRSPAPALAPAPAPAPEPVTPAIADAEPAGAPIASPPRIAINALPRRRTTAEGGSALLERAVTALRSKRDPAKALFLLDEYEARFATGVLAPEAARLRIDALLLAGRRGRALDKLNELKLSEGARDLELGLIRGELRSAAGDCARAVGDFERVLSLASDGSMRRRAQAGRAACIGSGL